MLAGGLKILASILCVWGAMEIGSEGVGWLRDAFRMESDAD